MTDIRKLTPSKPAFIALESYHYLAHIYLSLDDIDVSDLREKAKEEGFRKKDEYHITVMGFESSDAVEEKMKKLDEKAKKKLIARINKLFQEIDWFFTLGKRYHIRQKSRFNQGEYREAYIQQVNLPGIEIFYQELNRLLGTDLPVQFTHVTLFIKGEENNPDYMGIPIQSREFFETLEPREL